MNTPARLERLTIQGDPDAAKKLFEISIRRDTVLETIRTILNCPNPELVQELLQILETKERLRLQLALDYQNSLETLNFYELLNEDKSYTADYFNPENPKEDFRDQRFQIPTLSQIFQNLPEEKLALYKKMEEKGLKPRLQLTPLAKTIRSLAKHLDAHKTLATDNTHIWRGINDHELIYSSTEFRVETDENGRVTLEKEGGISKAEWISVNKGWLVDIVATKQDFEANKELQQDKAGRWLTIAEQSVNVHDHYQKEGYSHMSYETYLLAQMKALREGQPLEPSTWTMLLDSSIVNNKRVAGASWFSVRVSLNYSSASYQNYGLPCRPSVRVLC